MLSPALACIAALVYVLATESTALKPAHVAAPPTSARIPG